MTATGINKPTAAAAMTVLAQFFEAIQPPFGCPHYPTKNSAPDVNSMAHRSLPLLKWVAGAHGKTIHLSRDRAAGDPDGLFRHAGPHREEGAGKSGTGYRANRSVQNVPDGPYVGARCASVEDAEIGRAHV